MTTKAEFNAEEWATIVGAAPLAGLRVVAASRGGTIRESVAMGKVYQHAREQHGASELLDELVSSPPSIESIQQGEQTDIGQVSTERLQQAVSILEQKATPEELDSYKHFVLTLAEAAARAHKEGGFLGIGGREVSEEEQAVLDDLAAKLQLAGA